MIYEERYDCVYSAEGKGGKTKDALTNNLSVPLKHYYCFSRIYGQLRQNNYSNVTYRIYMLADNREGKNYNLCTKLETKKILRCLQKTVPFSYKFETGARFTLSDFHKEEVEYNVLVVNVQGNYTQHLWITSMLRCFFEFPYNVAAKEACLLQSEIKEFDGIDFTKENWINLYLTIAAQLGSNSTHGVVDFGKHPKARTFHEWKQKLAGTKGSTSVIDLLREGGGYFRNAKRIGIYSEEEYQEGVRSRAEKYVAAYKDKLSWKN